MKPRIPCGSTIFWLAPLETLTKAFSMKAIGLLLIVLIFATSIVATGETSRSALVEQRIERVINGLLPDTPFEGQYGTRASLKSRMAHYHTPGLSIAVIKDYKIDWARGFGVAEHEEKTPVTENTLFQAASISKPVFAVAVMKLIQDKKLDLDEDVNAYLTSWKVPKNGQWQPRITLRQLLSHSAGVGEKEQGFPGYLRSQRLPTTIEILNGVEPANSRPVVVTILPGTQMRYSGGGTTIAQQVIVDVLKKPFPEIMNELVLLPMGMNNSTYEQPLPKRLQSQAATAHFQNNIPVQDKWHVYPEMAAAGLWTTPSDLAKFGIELQLALKGDSKKVLSKESVEKMLTPQISENMGIGFFLRGSGDTIRFEHPGGNEGFRAGAVFYKNLGLGAVFMINSNEGNLFYELERAIAKEYAWPGYLPEEKKAVVVAKKVFQNLAGNYVAKNGVNYEIAVANGKLLLKLKNQTPIELTPESPSKFFIQFLNSTVTFDKNALVINQNGNEIRAYKIKVMKK